MRGASARRSTGKLLTLDRQLEPLLLAAAVRCWMCRWTTSTGSRSIRRRSGCALWTRASGCCCARAQVQPLVVVFEDLHWIDSETQALLDSLVESLPTARLLLLVNYRPEYQHRWGARPTTPSFASTR